MLIKLSDERLRKHIPDEAFDKLSRSDLLVFAKTEYKLRSFLEAHVRELEEKIFVIGDKYFRIHSKMFSPSSEKSERSSEGSEEEKTQGETEDPSSPGAARKRRPKLPSERYPNAEIIEKHITCETPPSCTSCGGAMEDSGMTEVSEYLTVIPKQYIIVEQHRHKYRCSCCHGSIVTAPPIPRIVPGGSYSDELITDATLSKFCDLIPMDRYAQIAERAGFEGLPPQSLISASFKLAEFLQPAYDRLREETLTTEILAADETPHRMLEGDDKRQWYLWGFSNTENSCFFECHDTRSGDIAKDVLVNSSCTVLVSDVYSGYLKAVREANEMRLHAGKAHAIAMAFCNAHARRNFKHEKAYEAHFMISSYKKIYRIEALAKGKNHAEILALRAEMRPLFVAMKQYAEKTIDSFSDKSTMAQALNYFLRNYDGLTLFLTNPRIPIDNNGSERLLRSPVVGRKTWYGTHSKEGAQAAAIHFSIVQAAKLNKINPRDYYRDTIQRLHKKITPLTPAEYRAMIYRQIAQNTS